LSEECVLGRGEKGTCHLYLDETGNRLAIYVAKNKREKELTYLQQLPEALAKLSGSIYREG
jgi:hypothetical protein